jgi:DNA polymerase III sliding clamp (beta) subunit (PCNA family)
MIIDRIEIIENKISNLENLIKLLQSNNIDQVNNTINNDVINDNNLENLIVELQNDKEKLLYDNNKIINDNEQFKDEINELKILIEGYKRQIQNLEEGNIKKIDKISEFNSKIKELEHENFVLSEKLIPINNNELQNKYDSLNNNFQLACKEEIKLKEKINEQNKEIENLKLQLDDLKAMPVKKNKKISVMNNSSSPKKNIEYIGEYFIQELKYYCDVLNQVVNKKASLDIFKQIHIVIKDYVMYLYNPNMVLYKISLDKYCAILDNIEFAINFIEFKKIIDMLYKENKTNNYFMKINQDYKELVFTTKSNNELRLNYIPIDPLNENKFDYNFIETMYNIYKKSNSILNIPYIDFKNNINKIKYCMAKEETRYILNGVYIHKNKDENILNFIATDGKRLSDYKNEYDFSIDKEIKIYLTSEFIKIFDKINVDKYIDINTDGDKYYFEFDNLLLITCISEHTYPDYQNVIPKDMSIFSSLTLDKKDLLEILNNMALLKNSSKYKDIEPVDLFIKQNELTINFNGQINKMFIDYNGDEKQIRLQFRFLHETILNNLMNQDTIEILFSFESPRYTEHPIIIKSYNDKNIINIIMPMKIDKKDNE